MSIFKLCFPICWKRVIKGKIRFCNGEKRMIKKTSGIKLRFKGE